MICKHCSTKNAETAVFCKNCGKRLDGKKNCPKCSAQIDEDATFCSVCGARIDGKTVCPDCGAVYDGNFCPTCGKAQVLNEKPADPLKTQKADSGWKKILSVVGLSVGFSAAVFAFIFMFFMGTSFNVAPAKYAEYVIEAMGSIFKSGEFTIFDCFGNNFEFVNTLEELPDGSYTLLSGACWFYAILETLIASATIICTTTFFIIAVCRFIKSLLGKQTKQADGAIFATIISFITGAVCLRSLVFAHISVAISASEKITATYNFNGATIAGIVIALIFCAVMIVLKITTKGSNLRGAVIYKIIFSGACMIISVILLLAFSGQFDVTMSLATTNKIKVSGGFNLIINYISSVEKFGTIRQSNIADDAFIWGIVGYIVSLALIILIAVFAVYSAIKTIDEKRKSAAGITSASIITVLFAAFIIVSIIVLNLAKQLLELQKIDITCKLNTLPFALTIFSVIMLAAEIACLVIQRKNLKQIQEISSD